MIKAELPTDERQRLQALFDYDILDTEAEKVFDDLTQLASEICDTPIALISLVDPDRQWFKSATGIDAQETSRDIAFCSHAIHQRHIFEIPDASKDIRFHDNPLVTGDPKIRFYAGAQLVTPDGYAIGTLCAISDQPKTLTTHQRNALEILSREVISQLELRQKLQQLKQAGENKTAFLSDMSHEIRTPLNGIMGTLELLIDSGLNPAQKNLVNLALQSSESLLAILNDVLDLSKIEAGQIDLDLSEFDLMELLADVASVHSVQAESKNIDLLCPANFIPHSRVRADALRIRQVMNNLISNAIKFTEEGEVCVGIEMISESDKQLNVRFSVRDTGIGLTDEQVSDVFKRFRQADASISRHYGGTGLGLTISRQLVDLMGGTIGVQSQPGEGAVFWFTLPLDKSSQPESVAISEFSDMRVLVLHGHPCYQQLLNDLLSHWQINHQVTAHYESALEVLENAALSGHPFNTVLIDEKTEQTQSSRFLERVSERTDLSGLHCILLSHPVLMKDSRFYQSYDAVIRHPIVPSELYNALLRIAGPVTPSLSEQTVRPDKQYQGRVLVAEDNLTNQIVTRGILEKYGLTVHIAENGQRALELLAEIHFDLIFMDCQMPVMDGYQATRQIRALTSQSQTSADIPVIALSANVMAAEAERCFQVGMSDYLSKPVKRDALEKILHQWLSPLSSSPSEKSYTDSACSGNTERVCSESTAAISSQQDTEEQTPIFDVNEFAERMLGDKTLMQAAIEPVLKDLPVQVKAIRQALQDNDEQAMKSLLHQSKGMLANVSAIRLAEQLKTLESEAPNAVMQAMPELEHNILLFMSQVQRALFENE